MRARDLVRYGIVLGTATLLAALLLRPGEHPRGGQGRRTPAEEKTRDGFVLVDARKLRARIARSRAKGIVVGAWASWCGSCKEDLPILLGLRKTFDAGSIEVHLVSVDDDDGLPKARELLASMGAEEPSFVVQGPLEAFKQAMNPAWPGMLPATFLFDREGHLHHFWGGTVYEDEIVPVLRRYLAGEDVHGETNFALAPGATAAH